MIENRVQAPRGGLSGEQSVGDPEGFAAKVEEVLAPLRKPQKRISSKYHYDARGSELFEEITRLDEYYPTRTERGLLKRWMPAWVKELRPATLVELGAGNSEKSRIILDAMVEDVGAAVYAPVDVSADFLNETAELLQEEYPQLDIEPVVADILHPLDLPPELPSPHWIAFLGSTLGNFEPNESTMLLRTIANRMAPCDRFLLGVDLRPGPHKSAERIELAYNDPAGVTSEFSVNVLAVLNEEVGTDFDPSGFRHRSFYSAENGRIETYLDSVRDQVVTFPGGETVSFREGEETRTEISCKYDRPTIDDLFKRAGLSVDRWVEDDQGYYALVLASLAT